MFRKVAPLCVFAVLVGLGLYKWRHLGDNSGYAPEQPIAFSHKLHAGDNQIPCLYCHSNAEKGDEATIPAMNVCMNCHSVVATDRPAIQQIKKLYEDGKSVEWVRVHDLPDFVYFSHRWHVAKGFKCQECHGPVENMDAVRQVNTLQMGWCVDCHRKNKTLAGDPVPIECTTCHK